MVCFGFGRDGGAFEEAGALGELAVPEEIRGLDRITVEFWGEGRRRRNVNGLVELAFLGHGDLFGGQRRFRGLHNLVVTSSRD
jgi:hypothetical protein